MLLVTDGLVERRDSSLGDDLADLAHLDDQLWRIRGNDQHVGVGLDEDTGFALVGVAHFLAGGNGLGDPFFEVGSVADAFAVAASAAEVGQTVGFGGLEAIHSLSQHRGEGVLPCPPGPSEDHGLGKMAGADALAQPGYGRRVSQKLPEAHGSSVEHERRACRLPVGVARSQFWSAERKDIRRRETSVRSKECVNDA